MAILPREPLKFERQDCTRCGGSGRYSFNLMDGDRCFGCAGRGITLTKRGAAAQRWLKEKRQVEVSTLKVGDRIKSGGLVFTIQKITQETHCSKSMVNGVWVDNPPALHLHGKTTGYVVGPTSKVELQPRTNDELIAQLTEALEYEATLGVSGKPLKRRTAT